MYQVRAQPAYEKLQKLIAQDAFPLTLMLGSGPSQDAGLPSWFGLRNSVQKKIDTHFKIRADKTSSNFRWAEELKTKDFWDFFDGARKLLLPGDFDDIIESSLDKDVSVPQVYHDLLRLKPRGVTTLNLDRLAGSAMTTAYGGEIEPIYGMDLKKKYHAINQEKPFLLHLHGHISDRDTWVLTKSDLAKLNEGGSKKLILSHLYMNHTMLLYGISIDDESMTDVFDFILDLDVVPQNIFWLTNRTDSDSDNFCRKYGVRKIIYDEKNYGSHEAAVKTIVSDLCVRMPESKEIPPSLSHIRHFDFDSGNEGVNLANTDPNITRMTLSNLLREKLIGLEGDALYEQYMSFVKEHHYAIETRAFYISEDRNDFFDYNLEFPRLGQGHFGQVFSAKKKSSDSVAIKIMNRNILNKIDKLGGFRRGIQSMRIITEAGVEGVCKIVEAFEMPPTIVMEYIDKPSFQDIFPTLKNYSWYERLKAMLYAAKIVHSCHRLPKTVFHRDLKPSNIMVEVDWHENTLGEITVLDFDMSWHKGSKEQDIIFDSRDDLGYLAPEQTNAYSSDNARSAKVDTYGLAMTLFAVLGRRHPVPSEVFGNQWHQVVRKAVLLDFKLGQNAIANKITRAIIDATKIDQGNRLHFDLFLKRLEKCSDFSTDKINASNLDMFAEQFLFELVETYEYEWDDLLSSGKYESVSGLIIDISIPAARDTINLAVRLEDRGNVNYRNRQSFVGKAKDEFVKFDDKAIISKSEFDLSLPPSFYIEYKCNYERSELFDTIIDHGKRFVSELQKIN